MSATLSYRAEFEAAYIQNHELNAHRYRVEVTVDGPQRYADNQQILDYRTLATYVKEVLPDGKWLMGQDSDSEEAKVALVMMSAGVDVLTLPYSLCIERLCKGIADELQDILNRHEPGVRVIEVKLRETADSFATWSIG